MQALSLCPPKNFIGNGKTKQIVAKSIVRRKYFSHKIFLHYKLLNFIEIFTVLIIKSTKIIDIFNFLQTFSSYWKNVFF